MKLVDLDTEYTGKYLKITDLENIFDIFIDKRKNAVFNMNETLYINIDKTTLPEHVCSSEMHWTTLSYQIYGTTRLAWLLLKINDVEAKDIFVAKQPGDVIKYLPKQYVNSVVANINEFDQA